MNKIATLKLGRGGSAPARPVDLEAKSFPDQPAQGKVPPATIANVRHMLDQNGIAVRYNVIKKRTEITVPWLVGTAENADSVSMTHILSLAASYGVPLGLVPALVEALGDENAYNPAADWIHSKAWDGEDRIQAICDTVTVREGYPEVLKNRLIYKWLLSVTAAAVLSEGFRARGVFVLQGKQGIGKTSWGLSLINDETLQASLIKVDHMIDPGNKDTTLGAIDHWFVELGELDSSLRRDMSRLKGFLTSNSDKIRRPYGRVTVDYPRRTVFYATINVSDFLADPTGNTRWWTVAVDSLNYTHDIDMQQVFAQLAVDLKAGHQWWLTGGEERMLEEVNSLHRSFSLIRDNLMEIIDLESKDQASCRALTASEVLRVAGFDRPTNSQAKECADLLRGWFGESKRINGRDKWRVPLRPEAVTENLPLLKNDKPVKDKFD